jgi:hypothetical protein
MVVCGPLDKGHLCLFVKEVDDKEFIIRYFYTRFDYLVGDPSSMSQKAMTILIIIIWRWYFFLTVAPGMLKILLSRIICYKIIYLVYSRALFTSSSKKFLASCFL